MFNKCERFIASKPSTIFESRLLEFKDLSCHLQAKKASYLTSLCLRVLTYNRVIPQPRGPGGFVLWLMNLKPQHPSPAWPLLRQHSYLIFLTMYIVLKEPEIDSASGSTTSGWLLPTAFSELNESLRIGRCPAHGNVLCCGGSTVYEAMCLDLGFSGGQGRPNSCLRGVYVLRRGTTMNE